MTRRVVLGGAYDAQRARLEYTLAADDLSRALAGEQGAPAYLAGIDQMAAVSGVGGTLGGSPRSRALAKVFAGRLGRRDETKRLPKAMLGAVHGSPPDVAMRLHRMIAEYLAGAT